MADMGKIETISVDLSDDLADLVHSAVAGGEFASTDHVVRAALDDWKRRREADLDHLRTMLAEGVASGFEPHGGMEAIKHEARRRLAERQQ